jgi:hypothetical protein
LLLWLPLRAASMMPLPQGWCTSENAYLLGGWVNKASAEAA